MGPHGLIDVAACICVVPHVSNEGRHIVRRWACVVLEKGSGCFQYSVPYSPSKKIYLVLYLDTENSKLNNGTNHSLCLHARWQCVRHQIG